MNLFIDTNIFLSFYHLTNDDLEELRKLSVLLEKGEVSLFLTDQVINEFRRNRENKISDSIKKLKEQKLNLQFPQLCKDYPEYPRLRELQKEYETEHNNLLKQIISDVENNSLKADKIIEDLFDNALSLTTTDTILSAARMRIDIGNPPGKKGSLGDAINWEILLQESPNNESMHLISDDGDYFSVLNEYKPKEFLAQEWEDKKDSFVVFYRRLSPFFKEHYPNIKVASELEKEILINRLVTSGNFANTHNIIAKLSKYEDFSEPQINDIIEAALSNNQISTIIGDEDVFIFLDWIYKNYTSKINPDLICEFGYQVEKHYPSENEDNQVL